MPARRSARGRPTSGSRLDVLGAERIDHGVAIVEDPDLVRRVAAERDPADGLPDQQRRHRQPVRSPAEHPFRAMREAGLLLTLNTDDPAMTDLDLGKEYRTVADALALDFRDDIAAVALDGVEASWLDPVDQASLRREFTEAIDDLRPPAQAHPPDRRRSPGPMTGAPRSVLVGG